MEVEAETEAGVMRTEGLEVLLPAEIIMEAVPGGREVAEVMEALEADPSSPTGTGMLPVMNIIKCLCNSTRIRGQGKLALAKNYSLSEHKTKHSYFNK